jgi:hypothetical protein
MANRLPEKLYNALLNRLRGPITLFRFGEGGVVILVSSDPNMVVTVAGKPDCRSHPVTEK